MGLFVRRRVLVALGVSPAFQSGNTRRLAQLDRWAFAVTPAAVLAISSSTRATASSASRGPMSRRLLVWNGTAGRQRGASALAVLQMMFLLRFQEYAHNVIRQTGVSHMARRNLSGGWGESRAMTVRLSPAERMTLRVLRERWGCTASGAIRRALREAAAALESETATAGGKEST